MRYAAHSAAVVYPRTPTNTLKQLASKALILTAGPFLLAVSASAQVEKVYWTNSSTGSIKRVNPDGTGVETLLNNFGTPLDLAFDRSADKMVWTDLFGAIRCASLAALPRGRSRSTFQGLGLGIEMEYPILSVITETWTKTP